MALQNAFLANEFVVEIDGAESPSVSKVSGLNLGEVTAVEVYEGGTNIAHKVPSNVVKYQPLIIERYVDRSRDDGEFQRFFEDSFKLRRGVVGPVTRRQVAVVKKHNGIESMRFVFYGAFVSKVEFTDLEAGATETFKQTVTLEHDGVELVYTG